MNKFDVTLLTLFPEMFPGPLGYSLAGKALEQGIWSLSCMNIRDFAEDKHATVDDTPYGGGGGMVLRPDIIDAAITKAKETSPNAQMVYMSPRGVPLSQRLVEKISQAPLTVLCGRFEAVDQRVLDLHQPLEISIGDVVLSGGEIAAMALIDACVRLLPGVVGDANSLVEESFGGREYTGLLEYPHYTKPPVWRGLNVPEILLSGNHGNIARWRLEEARNVTKARRPDLWEKYVASLEK